MKRCVVVMAALVLLASSAFASPDVIYTSSRNIVSLAVTSDGATWAATRGGVLRLSPSGECRKFTQSDGLPSNEVMSIAAQGDTVTATFANANATFENGRWLLAESAIRRSPTDYTVSSPSTTWGEAQVTATLDGLRIARNGVTRTVPLPPSTGSHISALLPRGNKLWAALFGDGIWEYDGQAWKRANIDLPDKAGEITAMAAQGSRVWLGTRRDGAWLYDSKSWSQRAIKDEPYDHNCQNLCDFNGSLFVSTLEDGLVVRNPNGWSRCVSPDLSSNAPRQMVVFGGCLYLRHGSGKVDRFDGKKWARDVFALLPRKQVSTMATDANRLYAAQWGGWSEFDGKTWTHHLKIPDLQGLPITALLPDGENLWVGTQGRGLAQAERSTEKIVWHDETRGMPDDYIRAIARVGDTVFAGTFCGGLAVLDGERWVTTPEFDNAEITSLAPDGAGGVFVATRKGVFLRSPDGKMARVGPLGLEAQGILVTDKAIWIGARTGLIECTRPGG
jgi:ligand-binding sensor domain-containing protein